MARWTSAWIVVLPGLGCVSPWVAPAIDTSEIEGRFLPCNTPREEPLGGESGAGPTVPSLGELGELTPGMAIALALENRPELDALDAAIDAAGGRRLAALAYPYPEAEVSGRAEDPGAQGIPSLWLTWAQPIVLSDRRELGASVADAEAEAAAWDAAARRLEIAAEVQAAFNAVVAAQSSVELSRESAALASDVLRVTEALLAAERVAETAVLLARSASQQQQVAVDRAQAGLAAASAALATVVGLPGEEIPPCRVPEADLPPTPASSADLERHLVDLHPALLAARVRVEAAEREVDRQESLAIPDLTFGVSYGQAVAPVASLWSVSIGMPVPLFDTNRGGVAEAEAFRRAAEADVQAAEARLIGRLREALAGYEGAATALQSIRDNLLPVAEESYRRAETGYREGKTDYLSLLDARRALNDARAGEIAADLDARNALASIEALAGPIACTEESP